MKTLNKNFASSAILALIVVTCSCSGDDDGPSCDSANPVAIATMIQNADCGSSNGVVTVNASGGDGQYEYSVNGGGFGNSNILSGLGIGEHEITVRDGVKCATTAAVAMTSGTSFTNDIAPIIATNCALPTCHVAGTPRVDLQVFSAVQFNAQSIKSRVESGDMPRNGILSAADIASIACWVDDGALDN